MFGSNFWSRFVNFACLISFLPLHYLRPCQDGGWSRIACLNFKRSCVRALSMFHLLSKIKGNLKKEINAVCHGFILHAVST